MNTRSMRSSLLLLLFLVFVQLLLLSGRLAWGVSTASSKPSSIALILERGQSALKRCKRQLLERPFAPLAAGLQHQPFPCSSVDVRAAEDQQEKAGEACNGYREDQQGLSAFLTPADATAYKEFKYAMSRSFNSPVYTGSRQQVNCTNAQGRREGLCLQGWQGDKTIGLSCTYTERKSAVFAANGAGHLARIPLSTKQLKRREQAEKRTAETSRVKEREEEEDKEGPEKRRKRIKDWRVVLHNDDIHTFECVENAITKVLPHISRARAYDIALHAHTNLKATIMLTWEEKATEVALALQKEGLTVSVLPDKLFRKQEEQKE